MGKGRVGDRTCESVGTRLARELWSNEAREQENIHEKEGGREGGTEEGWRRRGRRVRGERGREGIGDRLTTLSRLFIRRVSFYSSSEALGRRGKKEKGNWREGGGCEVGG